MRVEAVDPFSTEFAQCPFPGMARLRHQQPVYQVGHLPLFLVTRYKDVIAVERDTATFSSSHAGFEGAMKEAGMAPSDEDLAAFAAEDLDAPHSLLDGIVHLDPPEHTRLRRLVNRSFTARLVKERWEPLIARQANDLIECFDMGRPVEFMAAFASPLPVWAIGSILGVPDEQQGQFKEWSDALSATSGRRATSAQWRNKALAITALNRLFTHEIEVRASSPKEDLLSELAQTTTLSGPGDDDLRLTVQEAVETCLQLLVAGNETTAQLLGTIMLELCNAPDLFAALQADRTLVSNLVEECLRFGAPIVGLPRFCRADTVVNGVSIPKGSVVMLMFGSANRDAETFADPDVLSIDRSELRRHIAFGSGVHTCLGAPLARAEARIATEKLLDRLHRAPRLASGHRVEREWSNFMLSGMSALYVEM